MIKISSRLILVMGLLMGVSGAHAVSMNKCMVGGTVTYQQDPCPSKQVRKPPTIQELNVAEKKRREAAAAAAPDKVASAPERLAPAAPIATTVSSGYSCDGRKYCSQMKSCAEAKYFLANCPGVKMDGDGDGIPCEEQWCIR